ncbi:protein longifolia 2 [Quercus suber]|uniref:Protein longifolia 2 n=1 Tax=Quercus suber TaxID=58331 RepID=A0AAW0LFP5_QUESU
MPAKVLHTLTDENQDLQKQIGCMNGFFQLFDRHHSLTGRRINSDNHKRLPPGQNDKKASELSNASQTTTEKIPKKLVKEKQRVSTESSKSSFSSSSRSSSFSSLDHNKTAQIETSSFNQTIFPETPTQPTNQPNVSLQLRQPSLDLRDIVKDSIYREARALSVKTGGKEGAMGNTLIYIDSPRPLQAPKSVKPRATGLNDSFRILAKLREAPRNYKEQRDGFTLSSLKDAPRLSYDGRISQDAYKSTIKLKELPRLSLDSRQGSIRGSAPEPKSDFLLKDLQRRNGNSGNMLNHQQEPEISKRPSSIVAKLMGLESTPQSTSTSENSLEIMSSCQADKYDRFSEATDETKQNQISRSPRNSQDHISPRLKNADSVMRPTSGSKFPIEPAPWRQPEGSQSSELPAFMYGETTSKAPSCPSVYGEIEKRLSELEFKKSGKDLRALKQILEGMQKTRESLDTKRERAANLASQTSKNSSSYQSSNLASPRKLQNKDPISATIKGSPSPKSHKSPTVIMKPVNLIRRTSDPASSMIPTENMSVLWKPHGSADGRKFLMQSAKDLVSRNNHIQGPFSRLTSATDKTTGVRTSKSASALKLPRHIIGENNTCSATVSPRLQQRKFGLQKQSLPPTIPSSDSSKTNRQYTKQPVGPNSPGRKVRPRSPNLQQCNEQLSEISSAMRDLSHEIDAISLKSESSINFNSHMDTELTEVTSTNQSDKIYTTFLQQDGQKQSSLEGFKEDRSMAEPAIATMEQPSPISVLDATFYRDESPSPVKKISNAFKENIQHFVQNLQQIYRTDEEPITNYISPLHESTNSDHRYISEILLASGLLRDLDFGLMTIQLQASSHPIDYKVFLALEQKKEGAGLLNDTQSDIRLVKSEPTEKIQRKLTFDAVNEILVRKLLLEGPHQHWFLPNKLAGRKPRGQQLLEELCSEVDQLKNNNLNRSLDEEDDSLRSIILEDLRHQSVDWIDCHCEISGVVLDVERLIFKDLITDVFNSEVAGLQGRPGGHCRKLFSKYGI